MNVITNHRFPRKIALYHGNKKWRLRVGIIASTPGCPEIARFRDTLFISPPQPNTASRSIPLPQKRDRGITAASLGNSMELQIQFQIALFDPADLAEHLADHPAKHRRQHETNQHKANPIHSRDGSLRTGCDITDPARIHADLTHEAAGAHAGRDRGAVHLQPEQTGGNGAGDGRSQRGRDPDFRVPHDVRHLQHTGADALRHQAAPAVFPKAHDGKAHHLRAAARHRRAAGQARQG